MPKYIVSFDNVAFSSSMPASEDPVDLELTTHELGGFNDTKTAEGTFQKGVLAVHSCTASPDDSVYKNGRDEANDLKLFVNIQLMIEAEDQDAAEAIDPDKGLLATLTDMLAPGLELEEDWDMIESELYEAPAATPAP